jgi:gamma-glutamyl-gamma-aminobutyrate hydrolase PuuD
MPPLVALSQRVDVYPERGERRDALDSRWMDVLSRCGLIGVALPNHPQQVAALLDQLSPTGICLTGGNDIVAYGGDAPERDAAEALMIDWAERNGKPVLAVCRGLQLLMHRNGIPLEKMADHVAVLHPVQTSDGTAYPVNSYHNWGFRKVPGDYEILATATDGSVEAVRSRNGRILGIMWHPERNQPYDTADIASIKELFTA